MKKLIILSLFASIAFWSCRENQVKEAMEEEAQEETAEDVKQIIKAKNDELVELYRAGAIDSIGFYFAENLVQLPPNSPAIRGKQQFKEAWTQNMDSGTWEFTLETQEVRKSGDMAVELGKYTVDFTPNEDSEIPAIKDKGNYVVMWEKIDGDWKIVWDAPVSEMSLIVTDDTVKMDE
ncbi:MAG: DUF4440 domain-containing protein [Fulvivirga sp.]|nr:DUF4440 domain-containing protein [Fulvivirga sp.]